MPTFKHPCPHCGKYINRDVAACPFCAMRDPFAPMRCANCRTVIEDASWAACPRCGQALPAPSINQLSPQTPPPVQSASTAAGATSGPVPPPAPGAAAPGAKCTGCGAAMAAGVRFCTVCGTLAPS